jgi:RecA/RadA recombinase
MAKAPIKINKEDISLEDARKIIKSMKGSYSITGKDEIAELCHVERLITDIPTLDFMGGFTKHRCNLLAGNPSACKSTIVQQVIPTIIKDIKTKNKSKFVLYFDIEGAYDEVYASALGIDQDYMIIKRSSKVMEDCFREATELIRTGFIEAVIFDSFDAMIPKKQNDNEFENTMGSQSGSIAAHFPTLFSEIIEHRVTCWIIKQARVKLGVQSKGEIITFNGGKALRHMVDNIFICKRMSAMNLSYTPIQIKAEKTRSSRMSLVLEMPLGTCGIDKVRDLLHMCTQVGILKVAGGGWTSFTASDGTEYKEQGSDKFLALLHDNPKVYNELKDIFYKSYVYNESVNISSTSEMEVDLDGEIEEAE